MLLGARGGCSHGHPRWAHLAGEGANRAKTTRTGRKIADLPGMAARSELIEVLRRAATVDEFDEPVWLTLEDMEGELLSARRKLGLASRAARDLVEGDLVAAVAAAARCTKKDTDGRHENMGWHMYNGPFADGTSRRYIFCVLKLHAQDGLSAHGTRKKAKPYVFPVPPPRWSAPTYVEAEATMRQPPRSVRARASPKWSPNRRSLKALRSITTFDENDTHIRVEA